ncbi:MAG TPA: hypothetical protein H9797_07140 [Candidatus Gallimonas gallistercoris]|uniref:Uncharacterized protein n=1 Tax=Candidatus Gallimonas gallistercoris TaxID=2838602 RepID=A0A9D2H401_9FIRM|nr:hypothetical protein [Candidatus Gallimonas gallistercoris]
MKVETKGHFVSLFSAFMGILCQQTEIPMQRVSFGGTLYFLQGGNTNGRKDRSARAPSGKPAPSGGRLK